MTSTTNNTTPTAPPPPSASAPPPAATPTHHHSSAMMLASARPRIHISPLPGGGPDAHPSQDLAKVHWAEHGSSFLLSLEHLLDNELLVDCTLVCEDVSLKAHKVVLSAISAYFQKIFIENPCKHPVIVLKDLHGYEVRLLLDFIYKGEVAIPHSHMRRVAKAAESLQVRGLAGDALAEFARRIRQHEEETGGRVIDVDAEPLSKMPHINTTANGGSGSTHSSQSSPMSLTHSGSHAGDYHHGHHHAPAGSTGSGPRRKQARPRRRSGDSIGAASSLDLSKADSPGSFRKTSPPHHAGGHDDATPENLSMKRPSTSPAINLVKTEHLLERDAANSTSTDPKDPSATSAHSPSGRSTASLGSKPRHSPSSSNGNGNGPDAFLPLGNGVHMSEHEARVEAMQALNYMAAGVGMPGFPHHPPHGHPGMPGMPGPGGPPQHSPVAHPLMAAAAVAAAAHGSQAAAAAAAAAAAHHHQQQQQTPGRPTSTPSTPYTEPTPAPRDTPNGSAVLNSGFEFKRISIDRSKMSEEEAFEHAIEMIQTRQMGFRKAADFFSVSKWKLYKTARKRGIYAEIKKQNQAQALSKVPTNVQHFADMGVYKQLKKKTHLTKDALFPHLPLPASAEDAEVYRASVVAAAAANAANNNNNNNGPSSNGSSGSSGSSNGGYPTISELQKKMFPKMDLVSSLHHEEERVKAEMLIRPVHSGAVQVDVEEEDEVDDVDDDVSDRGGDSGVLVISSQPGGDSAVGSSSSGGGGSSSAAGEAASPDDDEDSGREDSA